MFLKEEKNYYLPDTIECQKGIDFLVRDGYRVEMVPLDKLVKDNNLLAKGELDVYHKKSWDYKQAHEFQIDDNKAQKWKAWEIPYAIRTKNGELILNDGRHRCRALFNQGYDNVEILIKNENNSIKNEEITEDVEIHDELNPLLWDENKELLPEIKEKIELIINTFKDTLKDNKIPLNIEDVYLLGSNVNYNYNDESDLDIHLIVNTNEEENDNYLDLLYSAYKTIFNNKYDIKFKGIQVEIYVENMESMSNISNGVYSIYNGWIKEPSKDNIPNIDNKKLKEKVDAYIDKIVKISSDNKSSYEDIQNIIDDLYRMRQASIKKDGEFGMGNLIFKELRRLGVLGDLKELRDILISEYLSIE